MTRLWWVRHGPTHEKTFVGWRDVPADLSDLALIERVASYLPADAIVVSSDLQRASATADAIGKNRTRLPHDRNLREFDFGAWDGMHFKDVAERDPDLSRRFWEDPGDLAAPNGESWNAVAARVGSVVDGLCARYHNADLVLVAHIGVIMTQIQRARASTAYEAMGHHIDNLSVTDMTYDDGTWHIGQINHIP
jgi:broad specificity phosphatase PhoE